MTVIANFTNGAGRSFKLGLALSSNTRNLQRAGGRLSHFKHFKATLQTSPGGVKLHWLRGSSGQRHGPPRLPQKCRTYIEIQAQMF